MFDTQAAEVVAAERAAVLDILDAMMRPDQGRHVLNWRIEAKMAQAALLTRATFLQNQKEAQRAKLLAMRNVDTCKALLLS